MIIDNIFQWNYWTADSSSQNIHFEICYMCRWRNKPHFCLLATAVNETLKSVTTFNILPVRLMGLVRQTYGQHWAACVLFGGWCWFSHVSCKSCVSAVNELKYFPKITQAECVTICSDECGSVAANTNIQLGFPLLLW